MPHGDLPFELIAVRVQLFSHRHDAASSKFQCTAVFIVAFLTGIR
jgi:hypothetical protein